MEGHTFGVGKVNTAYTGFSEGTYTLSSDSIDTLSDRKGSINSSLIHKYHRILAFIYFFNVALS